MARVRTFRAWRYLRDDIDITPVTSPPYDVISDQQRAEYAADPYNVVALELPEGPADPETAGNRYATARATWDAWRESGVLVQDKASSLYVLEQRFELGGQPRRRRAFIVEVGLEPFESGIILPHERTLPKALGDRFELIKATAANFSQVFGLFDDPEGGSDSVYDAVTQADPVATATDKDGVRSVLWASTDQALAERVSSLMADRQIFIADGHHRYATALAYRDLVRQQAGVTEEAQGGAPSEFILMALVNMDDPDLVVLPYNRVADGVAFDPSEFRSALSRTFELSELERGHPAGVLEQQSRPAFLVKTRADERPFLAVLRLQVDPRSAIGVERSNAWKSLDVAILQELVLWPLLGIHPDHPETLERIQFSKDAHDAFNATSVHDVAFVLRPTKLSELRAVSLAGETMPQKSTYFFPKLLSGLVFRSAE